MSYVVPFLAILLAGAVVAYHRGRLITWTLASLALLWGNRLLPTQLAGRDTWEIRVFCASWALVALWAIVRRNSGTLVRLVKRYHGQPCTGPFAVHIGQQLVRLGCLP